MLMNNNKVCSFPVIYTHQCCHCVESISPACSSATGPGACSCWTGDTASSNRLLWKQSGGCSPRLHRTTLRPWSCTSCTCRHTYTHSNTGSLRISGQWQDPPIPSLSHTHTSRREGVSVSNCVVMNILFPLDWAAGSPVCVCPTLFSWRSVPEDGLYIHAPPTPLTMRTHAHTHARPASINPAMLWYLIHLLLIVPPGCNILWPSPVSWRVVLDGFLDGKDDRWSLYLVLSETWTGCSLKSSVFIEELCIFTGSHFPPEHPL